ncbi:hypothetical protein AMATHDRAFT_69914 [Amanita thiersii Skay4041]|uniref:Hydrophobin n=1 Tax=Amanita thiersii Skay4041 TaxID=703135 RepID=A0A2A9NF67_9AGAR|nr:hypothetical protein AMATHDRAFT_69914 [Amanita thiersii Skay4041]
MMFIKAALFTTLVAATALAADGHCNTGEVQCCKQLFDSKSDVGSVLLSSFPAEVRGLTGQVGANCSPITAIGAGSTSCNTQTVCCERNNFNGLITAGCTPVNIA